MAIRYSILAERFIEERGLQFWIKAFGWQGGTHTQVGLELDRLFDKVFSYKGCRFTREEALELIKNDIIKGVI